MDSVERIWHLSLSTEYCVCVRFFEPYIEKKEEYILAMDEPTCAVVFNFFFMKLSMEAIHTNETLCSACFKVSTLKGLKHAKCNFGRQFSNLFMFSLKSQRFPIQLFHFFVFFFLKRFDHRINYIKC